MSELLFEIGTEEIPAGYIQPALDTLAAEATRKLAALELTHGAVRTYGTPRRLKWPGTRRATDDPGRSPP